MTVLELLDIDDLNTDPDIISSLPKQCIIAEKKVLGNKNYLKLAYRVTQV